MTPQEAAQKLLERRRARTRLHNFILYTNKRYKPSDSFSVPVCLALDKFLEDMQAGKRPIIVFQAPPQHGKSEIVSRKLPAYILGRFSDWRLGQRAMQLILHARWRVMCAAPWQAMRI